MTKKTAHSTTYDLQGHIIEQDLLIKAAQHCIRERFAQDKKIISSADHAKDYLQVLIGAFEHEVFYALWLDSQHQVIDHGILFEGSINSAMIYPRKVVSTGLACNAAAVIFAHNHPSGLSEPSQADLHITRDLKTALNLIEINMLDHFIIGKTVTSLAERGML